MKTKVNQLRAGVALSYATMAVQGLVSVGYTPVMLRLLGKSEYGVYSLASSVVSYLGLLSFGFDGAYMRFYARYRAKNEEESIARLNGMFLTLFSVISLAALAAGSVLAENAEALFSGGLTEPEIRTAKSLVRILIFNVALSFPACVFDSISAASEQYAFQRTVGLLKAVFNPFLTLPLLLMGYRSVCLAAVTTFLTCAGLIMNAWFCLKKLKTRFRFGRFDFMLLREIWFFSSYLFLNSITEQANWSADKFILGKMKGSADVAVYSIGSQFNTLYISFSTAISSVFIPRVNRIVAEDGDSHTLTELFARVGRVQFLVLSFLLTGFVFFGEYFIGVWAGAEYASSSLTAYRIALLLMVPMTVPLIQNLGIEIQVAKNRHRFRSVVYALIAAANVAVSVLLCPAFGGVGCAAGTSLALILGSGFLMNWYYRARIGLDIGFFWKRILAFFPAFLLPCSFGVFLRLFFPVVSMARFLVCGLVYTALFAFSMWRLGMTPFEKNIVLRPLRRLSLKFRPVRKKRPAEVPPPDRGKKDEVKGNA